MGFFSKIGKGIKKLVKPALGMLGGGGILGAIAGPLVGGLIGGSSARRQQTRQVGHEMELQRRQHAATAAEADIARTFSAQQAATQRDWSSAEADTLRDFTSKEAQIARDFSAHQAATQYQRGMEDMKAAGLNPILAYQQGGADVPNAQMAGAGMPSGANANTSQGNPASGHAGMGADESAMAVGVATALENIRSMRAQRAVTRAQEHQVKAQTRNIDEQTRSTREQVRQRSNVADKLDVTSWPFRRLRDVDWEGLPGDITYGARRAGEYLRRKSEPLRILIREGITEAEARARGLIR